MNISFSWPTQQQTNAALRHAATFSAGIVSTLGFVGILLHTNVDTGGAAQAIQQVLDGLQQTTDGLYKLGAVLGPLAGVVAGWFATRSAAPSVQAQSVATHIGDPTVQAHVLPAIVQNADYDPAVKDAVLRAADSIEGVAKVMINPAKADATVRAVAADPSVSKVTA